MSSKIYQKEYRITIRIDEGDKYLIDYLASRFKISKSEIIRKAVNFYGGAIIGGEIENE